MKLIKNMKIGTRLMIAFMVIAMIAAGVGLYGILSMNKINQNSEATFNNKGMSQGYVGYIFEESQYIRALIRDCLLQDDPAAIQADAESAQASYAKIQTYMDKLKGTMQTPAEKTMYDDLSTKLTALITRALEIINLSKTDKAAATTMLRDNVSAKVVTEAFTALDIMMSSNINDGTNVLAQQVASSNTDIFIMIGLVGSAVLLAIVLGIIVARSISKPVNTLMQISDKVSAGDFTFDNQHQKLLQQELSNNEISRLVQSIKGIVTAIDAMAEDVHALTKASIEGKLSTRADAEKHHGSYRGIVEGINSTLDAVIEPINEAIQVMSEMAKGNLKVNVTGNYQGDHAMIKNVLNEMIHTLEGYIGEISEVLGEIADGNLSVEITSEYKGEFVELKRSINSIINALNTTLTEINNASSQVATGTRQVSEGSQTISQGATEQASSIEELSATITQIAAQTKQNAQNANTANELANDAKSSAVAGNGQMLQLLRAMVEINESSENISKIIKVIDDIAFQTNILALNAAVEAARAGMHGKGFAVVAEEVRNLAAKSANAAKETTALIEGSMKKVEAGSKIADETALELSKIVSGVEKAAELVEEIAVASNEQATGIAQVNNGIDQLSQVVQTNSATAEEAAAASEELSGQAELLTSMVSQFRLKTADRGMRLVGKEDTMSVSKGPKYQESPRIALNDIEFGKY